MNDLVSRSQLLKVFNNKNIQITFDLPVEEVLGEDVDLDDFAMLIQDAIQSYKKMVIDTIKNQPTAYDIDKVVEQFEEIRVKKTCNKEKCDTKEICRICVVDDAIEIVKQGGVSDDVCEWKLDGVYLHSPHKPLVSCVNEENYRYYYCPVCGKKIKVVE